MFSLVGAEIFSFARPPAPIKPMFSLSLGETRRPVRCTQLPMVNAVAANAEVPRKQRRVIRLLLFVIILSSHECMKARSRLRSPYILRLIQQMITVPPAEDTSVFSAPWEDFSSTILAVPGQRGRVAGPRLWP